MNPPSVNVGGTDYFAGYGRNRDALEYRLDASEVIKYITDQLRGGSYKDDSGKVLYDERFRLMNDLGISKVQMFLHGFVNKVVHLTKYKNEDRVLIQVEAAAQSFNEELAKNMKRWGPEFFVRPREDETVEDFVKRVGAIEYAVSGEGKIRYRVKVRNRGLVMQLIENALLASMQRGESGFEADNTVKQISVVESKGLEQRQDAQNPIMPFGVFGGR